MTMRAACKEPRLYPTKHAGEWVQPRKRGYRMSCCDCNLVHVLDFRIKNGRVQFRVFRNERATAQLRRYRPHTQSQKPLVVIESPYAGDVEANVEYARRCMADSLKRGEFPIASHLLYTQPGILDDKVPEERAQGIAAGLAWAERAELTAVYMDLGLTGGMKQGIKRAKAAGRKVVRRRLTFKPRDWTGIHKKSCSSRKRGGNPGCNCGAPTVANLAPSMGPHAKVEFVARVAFDHARRGRRVVVVTATVRDSTLVSRDAWYLMCDSGRPPMEAKERWKERWTRVGTSFRREGGGEIHVAVAGGAEGLRGSEWDLAVVADGAYRSMSEDGRATVNRCAHEVIVVP